MLTPAEICQCQDSLQAVVTLHSFLAMLSHHPLCHCHGFCIPQHVGKCHTHPHSVLVSMNREWVALTWYLVYYQGHRVSEITLSSCYYFDFVMSIIWRILLERLRVFTFMTYFILIASLWCRLNKATYYCQLFKMQKLRLRAINDLLLSTSRNANKNSDFTILYLGIIVLYQRFPILFSGNSEGFRKLTQRLITRERGGQVASALCPSPCFDQGRSTCIYFITWVSVQSSVWKISA